MKSSYRVERIDCLPAKEFIIAHHYSRGCHNRPSPCYGLFDDDSLIGCLMLATPCSERVRAAPFGVEHKSRVCELHRLAIIDDTPKNTESWFIARCLKLIRDQRPDLWALVSFADTTQGHHGGIYRATNALHCGMTAPARFFLDETGRLRHPRQCGVNITLARAAERGWKAVKRQAKHRFVFILGNRAQKRERRKLLQLEVSA